MAESFSNWEEKLHKDVAELSLRRLSSGTVIAAGISLLLYLFCITLTSDPVVLSWCAAIFVIVAGRTLTIVRLKKDIQISGVDYIVGQKINRQAILFGVSDGLVWSSATWFMYSYNPVTEYLVVSLTLAATITYGLIYVFQPRAAAIAVGLAIVPSVLISYQKFGNDGYLFMIFVAAFCGATLFGIKELRRHILGYLQESCNQKIIARKYEIVANKEREANFIYNQQWSNTPLAAIEWDRKFRITRWNPSAELIFGYVAEEAIGKSLQLIFSADDFENIKQKWRTIWRGQKGRRSEQLCFNKNGHSVHCEWHDSALNKDGSAIGISSFVEDVSQQVRSDEIIKTQANFDNLTGLPNRRHMIEKINEAIVRSKQSKDFFALIFLDLDHFKDINDTQGHDVGDIVLKEFGNKLQPLVRHNDTVARFGGDEFVVLLENLGKTRDGAIVNTNLVADKLLSVGENLCKVDGIKYDLDVSGGIALFDGKAGSAGELLKSADLAMYQVKQNGRKGICFYDESLSLEAEYRVEVLRSLRSGLKNGEFELYSQPIVDIDGNACFYENLLRWKRGNNSVVPAADFIDILSNSPMIIPVGYWIFENVCENINKLREQGLWDKRSAFFVNVSPKQMVDEGFASRVKGILKENNINPQWVVIEITEESLIKSYDDVIGQLNELVDYGLRVALDDFGTGYSSLALLKDLPIQFLKLDKEFIRNLNENKNNNLIVEAIIKLCDVMSLKVIAEGVEVKDQLEVLKEMGCDYIQGYYFYKPMALKELENHLELTQQKDNATIYQFEKYSA